MFLLVSWSSVLSNYESQNVCLHGYTKNKKHARLLQKSLQFWTNANLAAIDLD